MKLSKYVKETAQQFLMIFALIIIVLTILRQFVNPALTFDLQSIYIIMAFSFISAGLGFILESSYNISEKNMRIRIAIHFAALETILISLAVIIGVVDSAASMLILALEIAVIYVVVRLLSWHNDKKVVEQINDGLKSFKKDLGE